jgi:hypothetical protein
MLVEEDCPPSCPIRLLRSAEALLPEEPSETGNNSKKFRVDANDKE